MGFLGQCANTVKARFDSACEWVREHKVAAVAIGVGLVGIFIGGMWIICKKDELKVVVKMVAAEVAPKVSDAIDTVLDTTEKLAESTNVVVPLHLRNLPVGQKASLAKLLEAQQMGIVLPDGKTIVDDYFYLRAA